MARLLTQRLAQGDLAFNADLFDHCFFGMRASEPQRFMPSG